MDDDSDWGWSGLDDIGSSVSNVASSLISSAGSLLTAQINAKVQQTTDQTVVNAQNALPVNNPNAWQHWVLFGGLALVAVIVVVELTRKG